MTTDGIVQKTETASATEQVSTGETQKVEVKPELKPEQTPQPLPQEQIQKMIADEVEKIRRTIQSDKDKAIAEVRREAERRIREAEMERQGIESSLGELDDETKTKIELAKYRARDRYSQASQIEEQNRLANQKAYESFNNTVRDLASNLEIDPSQIEWGDTNENLNDKLARISGQLKKTYKERRQVEKDSVQKTVKDEIAKARRELGLDSVDSSIPATVSQEYAGIPTKPEEFRKWIEKMPQDEYEKKWASKVTKMRREGLI